MELTSGGAPSSVVLTWDNGPLHSILSVTRGAPGSLCPMKTGWSSCQGRQTQRVSARRPSVPGTQCLSHPCQQLGKEESQLREERPADTGHPARERPFLPVTAQHAHPLRAASLQTPTLFRGPSRFLMETAPRRAGKPLPWPAPSLHSTARRGKEAVRGSPGAPRGSSPGRRVCPPVSVRGSPQTRAGLLGSGSSTGHRSEEVLRNGSQRAASSYGCCPAVTGARLDNGHNRNPGSLGVSRTAAAAMTLDGAPGPSRAETWPRPLPKALPSLS